MLQLSWLTHPPAPPPPPGWGLYIITVQKQEDGDLHVQFSKTQHACSVLWRTRTTAQPTAGRTVKVGRMSRRPCSFALEMAPPCATCRGYKPNGSRETLSSRMKNSNLSLWFHKYWNFSCLKTLQWTSQRFPWQQIPRRWFGKQPQLKHL